MKLTSMVLVLFDKRFDPAVK